MTSDESRQAVRFADCVEAAALYMATEPLSVRRAVVTHHPGERGGCAGCGPSVPWPCIVAFSARRAEELLAEAALARSRSRAPTPARPAAPLRSVTTATAATASGTIRPTSGRASPVRSRRA
jgi:hypothetical protein